MLIRKVLKLNTEWCQENTEIKPRYTTNDKAILDKKINSSISNDYYYFDATPENRGSMSLVISGIS